MVNTNKADGFGLGGSYCTVLSCSSVLSSSEAPGYENLGQCVEMRVEVVGLCSAPVR